MSSLDLKEFLAGYLLEVEEHLRSAGRYLLDAERLAAAGQPTSRPVRELYRSMHTIKGLSAMIGIEPVVELAHAMEAVLRAADRGQGQLEPETIDLLVGGVRAIQARVAALAAGAEVPPAPRAMVDALVAMAVVSIAAPGALVAVELPADLKGKISPAEAQELGAGAAAGRRAVRIDFVPSPARSERGLNITSVRERLGKLGDLVKVVPLSMSRSPEAPGGIAFVLLLVTSADDEALADAAGIEPSAVLTLSALPPPRPAAPGGDGDDGVMLSDDADLLGDSGGVVRVPVARLDDALERLSALVVTRFRLARAAAALASRGVDVRELNHIVQESGQRLRDLRASIMRARMISVDELLERVPLVVRGLSRTTGKEVRLEIAAHRAELDKAVGERLFPAVLHLVRNAVDHAIEPPAERERLGKPREGLIRVECHERANNQLELTVSDDGGGIDRARVAERAGCPVPASDEELLALIVQPGLTTRDEATTTSGRGLGMDIVKRIAVDQLRGGLALVTEPGRGTRLHAAGAAHHHHHRCLLVLVRRPVVRGAGVDGRRDPRGRPRPRAPAARLVGQRASADRPARSARRDGADLRSRGLPRAGPAECRGEQGDPGAAQRPPVRLRCRPDAWPARGGGAAGRGSARARRRRHRVDRPGRRSSGPGDRSPGAERAHGQPGWGERVSSLYVLFRVGDSEYVLPAADVLQMESYEGATQVPGTAPYVVGLVQMRGRVVPVIDLRQRFGLPAIEPTLDSRVVVVQHAARTVGLLVDSAREVIHLDESALEEPPDVLTANGHRFVQSLARAGNRLVMLIDFQRVVGEEHIHGQ